MQSEDTPIETNALAWLLELEKIDDPNLLNALILNVYRIFPQVTDVQLVIDKRNRRLLVWVELSFWGSLFKQKQTVRQITEIIKEKLPSFQIRTTTDINLLKQALEIIEKRNVR